MADSTNASLPRDTNSLPIQTLAPVDTTVSGFVLAATSTPTAMPTGAQIVEVAVTGNCIIMFGNAAGINVTSGTHRVLTPGVYTYSLNNGLNGFYTFFDAATVDGSTGRITVTKLI